MVDINLESMKDVEVKQIDKTRIEITLTDRDGSKVAIVTTMEHGDTIWERLGKVVVNEAYQYQTMQDEIDRLELEVFELREAGCRRLREAV